MEKRKIFVQIASYRDPQLVATVKDCLNQAKFPKNLKFCIAWQHSEDENIEEILNDDKIIILDIPFEQSKGACWARNQIQSFYNGEDFTLQLDSHHRFVKNWDEELIKMIDQLQEEGHKKPLLTGYVSSFNPENDPNERNMIPWKMNFDRFIPEGAVFFLPASIDDYKELTKPIPARFYSAHFCFTLGQFCKEVSHDPNYYFHGEEISIAVRAFTSGYDLFHPHKIICWHEYTRKGRTKHWDDDKEWGKKNTSSHLRNRKLFEMDGEKQDIDFGNYGLGKERSLKDYEKYAGISFKKRAVQKHTLENNLPPNPQYKNDEDFENSFLQIFKHCIDIQYSQVPEEDYDFWAVAFHKEDGTEVFRKDAKEEEIIGFKRDPDKYCKIWREFQTESKPNYWTVWPHSKSKGWCQRLEGRL